MLPAAGVTLHLVGASLAANPELADGARHGAGRGGGGFFIFPLLLLILGGFLLFRITRRSRYGHAMNFGAFATLNDRFARGEITREEFEYRRAVLNNDKDIPRPPPFAQPASEDPVDPAPPASDES